MARPTHTRSNPARVQPVERDFLQIIGAKVHNLKNINVTIPHHQVTVVTGVSGSGKSTLVFDLIYAEGRRRYMETLENNYVRNFVSHLERPDVDQISGLPCVIGIGQETTGTRSSRSTIGTLTDINSFLRLLFARASVAYSYLTGNKMVQQTTEQIKRDIMQKFQGKQILVLAPIVVGRKGHYRELLARLSRKNFSHIRVNGALHELHRHKQLDRHKIHDIDLVIGRFTLDARTPIDYLVETALYYGKGACMVVENTTQQVHYFSKSLADPESRLCYPDPSPNTFSFNSPYGACPVCEGAGSISHINQGVLVGDHTKTIAQGAIPLLGPYKKTQLFKQIEALLALHGYTLHTPLADIPAPILNEILYGKENNLHTEQIAGILGLLLKKQNEDTLEGFVQQVDCPSCQGTRLKKEALYFKLHDKNIAELSAMNLRELYTWFTNLKQHLTPAQNIIAKEPIEEIVKRLQFLLDMHLHYLSLNRPLQTLSGGEIRRIRLATQISTGNAYLVGLMILLDEPSIGLHQRDNQYVINAMVNICRMGNTVVVIEHDKETMLSADYLVEMGPGAGKHGGEIVAAGPLQEFLKRPSVTADYLLGKQKIEVPATRRKGSGKQLKIKGCKGRNLKNIDLTIPLETFIVVTGVSGSGKSTLIQYTLLPLLEQHVNESFRQPLAYESVTGLEHVNKIIEIDQSPIGRTPRSNPATYTLLFSLVRDLFTQLPQAKIRNYKAGRFSFNVKGGRCETCQGAGIKVIQMDFLPSVRVLCETCRGRRYNRETLEVQYRGKSIADVLDMTVENALEFFQNHPKIKEKLVTLQQVGLGYITLGQHATTLSGGEAQRVKLATELAKKDTGKTVYILNEPTTGLHFQDIKKVLEVLQKLVDKGNTIIVIEHNLDAIKVADHVIDLGPESGDQGGEIIAAGTPEEVARNTRSHTGRFLLAEL